MNSPTKEPDCWVFRKLGYFAVAMLFCCAWRVQDNGGWLIFSLMSVMLGIFIPFFKFGKLYKWSDPGIFEERFGQISILLGTGLMLMCWFYMAIPPEAIGTKSVLHYAAAGWAFLGSLASFGMVWLILKGFLKTPQLPA